MGLLGRWLRRMEMGLLLFWCILGWLILWCSSSGRMYIWGLWVSCWCGWCWCLGGMWSRVFIVCCGCWWVLRLRRRIWMGGILMILICWGRSWCRFWMRSWGLYCLICWRGLLRRRLERMFLLIGRSVFKLGWCEGCKMFVW